MLPASRLDIPKIRVMNPVLAYFCQLLDLLSGQGQLCNRHPAGKLMFHVLDDDSGVDTVNRPLAQSPPRSYPWPRRDFLNPLYF